MKLLLDFLIFISELVMLVCAIAFVVIAVRFVFPSSKRPSRHAFLRRRKLWRRIIGTG